jgi:hypothetical protein
MAQEHAELIEQATEDVAPPYEDPGCVLIVGEELSDDDRVHNARIARRAYEALLHIDRRQRIAARIAEEEIARLEAEIALQREWLEEERARIDAEGGRVYYESVLRHYVEQETAGTTRRYVAFPGGVRVSLRAQPPEWHWPEEGIPEELLAYARGRALVRATIKAEGPAALAALQALSAAEVPHTAEESLDKAGLKKGAHVLENGVVVDPNGEIIPGIRAETREDKLIYTIPEAPDATS